MKNFSWRQTSVLLPTFIKNFRWQERKFSACAADMTPTLYTLPSVPFYKIANNSVEKRIDEELFWLQVNACAGGLQMIPTNRSEIDTDHQLDSLEK